MATHGTNASDDQIIALGLIASQLEGAVAMLDDCLAKCPDELWDGRSPRTVAKYPFWMVAYHTLCFLDCYLSPSNAAFVLRTEGEGGYPPLHPKGIAELEEEYPSRRFEREELRRYVRLCVEKLRQVAAAETAATLSATAEFEWLKMNRLELYLYNLRHVAHHTGQLTAFLRRFGVETRWVRAGFADGPRG